MKKSLGQIVALFLFSLTGAVVVVSTFAADAPAVRFTKTQLDPKFRSEGVAVGDFNKDGSACVTMQRRIHGDGHVIAQACRG